MAFEKGHQRIESNLTQTDIDRIWELYFGKKWSCGRIAKEYDVKPERIISAIDSESERRWREKHPHETNRERLAVED